MQETSLDTLGWDTHFAEHFKPFADQGLIAARVAVEHRGAYIVYTELGELQAKLTGRARHDAVSRSDLPGVGDWVAAEMRPGENKVAIHAVLPRRGQFSRNVAGFTTEEQILAANIDTTFITTSLTGELNQRRLERYLTLAWAGGANPVVVLTKADICDALEPAVAQVEAVAVGVPVHITSSVTGAGIDELRSYFERHRTVALLGSSGVGKSSLVNALLGSALQDVQELRNDGKGKHTTTKRELIVLPGGGLMIDTPGMRELQLWTQNEGSRETFDDVLELAQNCHFTDCRHIDEPRCAVKRAIEEGTLAADRLEGFWKLQEELQSLETRKNIRAQIDEKRNTKTISQSLKKLYKSRDR